MIPTQARRCPQSVCSSTVLGLWVESVRMARSLSERRQKASWFGCGSGVVRVWFGYGSGSSSRSAHRPPCPASCASVLAVLAYWGEFGGNTATVAIHAARRGRWGGGLEDSTCVPADSEPEADMVDRHAKSGLESSKHTSVQNKSCSLLEIASIHIRLCSKHEA